MHCQGYNAQRAYCIGTLIEMDDSNAVNILISRMYAVSDTAQGI